MYYKTISKLKQSFYVDNCVTSVSTSGELKEFIDESRLIMSKGNFYLRGWEFSYNISTDVTIVPVLELSWNLSDTLSISESCIKNVYSTEKGITKRQILSAAQKVFDPIGFTCPVTVCLKSLLQEIWKQKSGWDEPVDSETSLNWVEKSRFLGG